MHWLLGLLGIWCWGSACAPSSAPPAGSRRVLARAADVRPGIDVLLSDSMHLVRGRRVGLLTNQAGVDARGVGDLERLRSAGIQVVALFNAEHGFRGTADPGAAVASSVDSSSGLPIYSLYGPSSALPDSVVDHLDLMVVDLPEVGARYFTYLTTTLQVMQSLEGTTRAILLLDRPNPIGGMVQGNVLDSAFRSPVGLAAVPMRHGMTAGELALLVRSDFGLSTRVIVVPVAGWRRNETFDQTRLPYIRPSPNLPRLESLFHYPGLCLFEGTNLSVGRGSEAPFEQIGAPWLDTAAVLDRVRLVPLAGVRFGSVSFTPRQPGDGKYPDSLVAGIRLVATDHASYDPTLTAVYLLSIIRAVHPDRFQWIPRHFDRLAGGPALREAIIAGRAPPEIARSWGPDLEAFKTRRRPFLLYPE